MPDKNTASSQFAQPLKVWILSLEYGPEISGGAGTHVAELARGLSDQGYLVTVLAFTPKEGATIREGNQTIHLIQASARSSSNAAERSMVEAILAVNDDLITYGDHLLADRSNRPDIIHYHNWLTFPAASHWARQNGISIVGTIHFLSEPVERWWGQTPDPEIVQQERCLFSQPHRIITVSHSLRSIIQATHGVSRESLNVVHNGLDVNSLFKSRLSDERRQKLRQTVAPSDEKILLYAGRLNPMKGITALLASAASVLAEYPKARYLVVGEPDSRDYARVIEEVFAQYPQLRGAVKLMGRIPRQHLAMLYQAADIALIPSVYDPFPYAALEAMAAGLPVIASDAGGLAEVVRHGETGFLVPVHTTEAGPHCVEVAALSAAQLRLLNDSLLAKEMGRAGQERILYQFNLERMLQSIMAVYQKVMAEELEQQPHSDLQTAKAN